MGRSNYTNRKIEGVKLGQVVAKDLTKRIPPSLGSKAAFRDPVVELDVAGKALGADGIREVVAALVTSMEYSGEYGRVVKLEELCLRDNRLDVYSLPAVSQVVKLAADDLTDLDLSYNLINVGTEEEAGIFESFLRCFADCCVLRRLDFHGNKLSTRGFEVLVKVYGQEPAIDMISAEKATSENATHKHETRESSRKVSKPSNLSKRVKSLSITTNPHEHSSEASNNDAADAVKLQEGPKNERKSSLKAVDSSTPDESLAFYRNTKGLRSIPYIILSDTDMTETCALHLSCIVQNHGIPEQLLSYVPPVKAGASTQQLLAYDSETQCQGIIYLPNPHIGNTGVKVLQLAEAVRKGLLDEIHATSIEISHTPTRSPKSSRRVSDIKSSPLALDHERRSTASGKDTEYDNASMQNVVIELERTRHRIQGNTLRDAGPSDNELWRTALKMLCLGRTLCPRKREEPSMTQSILPETSVAVAASPEPLLPPAIVDTSAPRATPLAYRSPNEPLTLRLGQEWRNGKLVLTPIPPPQSPKPVPQEVPPTPTPQSPMSPASPPTPPRQEIPTVPYRTDLPCGLSHDVWRRIAVHVIDANGIMSEAQQDAALRWAMNYRTLTTETESLGKPRSAQIWKVLDGVQCLTYDIRS